MGDDREWELGTSCAACGVSPLGGPEDGVFLCRSCRREIERDRRMEEKEHESPWLFTSEQLGAHMLVHVRCGEPGSRALLGSLTMRPDEWQWMRALATAGGAKIEELSS
jgi:hypothetical protein